MITTFKTRLVKKKAVAPNVIVFGFQIDPPAKLRFRAGQYLILLVPQPSGVPARRLFSIFTPPSDQKYFELLVEILPNGLAASYLSQISQTAEVVFQGPAGMFTLRQPFSRDLIFLATGTGVAPVYSMLRFLAGQKITRQQQLLFGLRTRAEVFLFEELKELQKQNQSFSFLYCLSREHPTEAGFAPGRVTNELEKITNLPDFDFYVCGGKDVVEALRQYLFGKRVPRAQVYSEKFTG
ncbi:hypothetical protein HY214_03905 [Candidatus Roizmanbacteria bacterium]|nr:hypothetical protein [Candidatus Roizmanbacteria bacterium]